MPIVFIGGTVVDVIFPGVRRLPAWPNHTEFTPANLVLLDRAPLVTIGGNGANAAYVAARLGANCRLYSNIAGDAFGGLAATWLKSAGVTLTSNPEAERTAVNVTANNARMQRATFYYPGSSPSLPKPAQLRPRPSAALICGWPHPSARSLRLCLHLLKRQGAVTAYDAGPLLEETPSLASLAPAFAHLDIFLSNEHELKSITRTDSARAGISALRRRFAGQIVIKLGPRGCLWAPPGNSSARALPGLRVKVVNTVGAGDTFNGALLAALDRKLPFDQALQAANRAAASVVSSGKGVLGLRTD